MRKSGIELNDAQTTELIALSDSPDEELARRARIVLSLGRGNSIRLVAAEEGAGKNTVSRRKRRFLGEGRRRSLAGMAEDPRPPSTSGT